MLDGTHFSPCPGKASGEGLHSFLQPTFRRIGWLEGLGDGVLELDKPVLEGSDLSVTPSDFS